MNLPNDKGFVPERSFEDIQSIIINLQRRRSPIITKMKEIQDQYEADIVIPNPTVKTEPDMPNLTPSLVTDVIDGLAMRAASQKPMTISPAIDPMRETGVRSMAYAKDRVRILNATYDKSKWAIGRRRALRHLNAYETNSLFVEPDFVTGMPKLRVRNPLETFPEERALENNEPPEYVGFITRFSGETLRARFPKVRAENGGPITDLEVHELWDIFEWVDYDQLSFGLLGPVRTDGYHVNEYYDLYTGPWMPLTDPMRNRAGVCLAVTPAAVTLHRIGNRLNSLLENTKWQNKLMGLDILAQEKSIFPDMYVLGSRGMAPRLVDGTWHDGRDGEMNIVENAESVGILNQNADPRTAQMIDRLERNWRVSSGHSPMMGGETPGAALRTGRALGQMAEIAIDPKIQELHDVDSVWMPHVNTAILEAYKGWWGGKKFTMFSGWAGDKGQLEFTPNERIETSDTAVTYAIPGADIMQITQVLGSLHGSEIISTETMQRYHPYVDDPHQENTTIIDEKLERSALEGMNAQLQTGQMPFSVFARIREKMRSGTQDVFKATLAVDDEIRKEQAAAQELAQQQQQAQPQEPNMMAQMGLAAGPGAAAPAAPPPGVAPPPAPGGPTAQMRAAMAGANPMRG